MQKWRKRKQLTLSVLTTKTRAAKGVQCASRVRLCLIHITSGQADLQLHNSLSWFFSREEQHRPLLLDETPSSQCVLPTVYVLQKPTCVFVLRCSHTYLSLASCCPVSSGLSWGVSSQFVFSSSLSCLSPSCGSKQPRRLDLWVAQMHFATSGDLPRYLGNKISCERQWLVPAACPPPPPTPIRRQSDALLACYCTHPSAPNVVVVVSFCPTNTKTAGNE